MSAETNGRLTFGDFVVAAYGACGRARAKAVVRAAVNAGWIVSQGRQRLLIVEEQHDVLTT
jgi:hypothetical protein